MRIKSLFVFGVVVFFQLSATAQVRNTMTDGDGRNISSRREKSQPATGSQYINERFMPAKISTDSKTVSLRYNGYADYFEEKTAESAQPTILQKDPDAIITFTVDSKKYAYVDYTDKKGEKVSGYLNLIADNSKLKIYSREKVIMEKEVFPDNSYQTYKAANYKKDRPAFFINPGDGQVVEMPTNKKDFSKLFGSHEKEVLAYIKENKIDLDDEKEIAQLAGYIGTII